MGTTCEIRFDNNPNATFQSGQTLTGTVILNLTEKKKFKGEVIVIFKLTFFCDNLCKIEFKLTLKKLKIVL